MNEIRRPSLVHLPFIQALFYVEVAKLPGIATSRRGLRSKETTEPNWIWFSTLRETSRNRIPLNTSCTLEMGLSYFPWFKFKTFSFPLFWNLLFRQFREHWKLNNVVSLAFIRNENSLFSRGVKLDTALFYSTLRIEMTAFSVLLSWGWYLMWTLEGFCKVA